MSESWSSSIELVLSASSLLNLRPLNDRSDWITTVNAIFRTLFSSKKFYCAVQWNEWLLVLSYQWNQYHLMKLMKMRILLNSQHLLIADQAILLTKSFVFIDYFIIFMLFLTSIIGKVGMADIRHSYFSRGVNEII